VHFAEATEHLLSLVRKMIVLSLFEQEKEFRGVFR